MSPSIPFFPLLHLHLSTYLSLQPSIHPPIHPSIPPSIPFTRFLLNTNSVTGSVGWRDEYGSGPASAEPPVPWRQQVCESMFPLHREDHTRGSFTAWLHKEEMTQQKDPDPEFFVPTLAVNWLCVLGEDPSPLDSVYASVMWAGWAR